MEIEKQTMVLTLLTSDQIEEMSTSGGVPISYDERNGVVESKPSIYDKYIREPVERILKECDATSLNNVDELLKLWSASPSSWFLVMLLREGSNFEAAVYDYRSETFLKQLAL